MEKENIPKETETIAARRAARLSQKLSRAGKGLVINKAWWSSTGFEVTALVVIFALNFYSVYSFFGTNAPENYFSGPIFPLLAKSIELFDIPLSYALQIINIFFFLIFPFSLYLFIRKVAERKMIAIMAVLIVSLPVFPFALVRVTSSIQGTDAAHIAALSVMPVAMVGLYSFLRDGGVDNLIITAVFSSIVALISPFGFLIYVVFASILTFSEMLLGKGRLKIFRIFVSLIFAGGLSSFWYNPGFFSWMVIGPMGGDIRNMVAKLIPISFFSLPILGVFGYLLFDRKPGLQPVFLASFFTITFAVIALAGGGLVPSHPSRYMAGFGISLAFLLGIVVVKSIDYLRVNKKLANKVLLRRILANGALTFVVVSLIVGIMMGRAQLDVGGGNVLGAWEGVNRGEIWQAKDRFRGVSSVLGVAITTGSVFGLGVVAVRGRNKEL